MSNEKIEKNLPEHYKLMADLFKHLSILSITFTVLGVGLLSNLFDKSGTTWPLYIGIPMLLLASIFSVLGHISYVEVFRVPHLFSGSHYMKLMNRTALPLLLFISGAVFVAVYALFGLIGI